MADWLQCIALVSVVEYPHLGGILQLQSTQGYLKHFVPFPYWFTGSLRRCGWKETISDYVSCLRKQQNMVQRPGVLSI